jgi:hypothetical protein
MPGKKYCEIIADNLSKSRLKLGLRLQRLIPAGERSGLQTRIATKISDLLPVRMKC